MGTYWCTHKSRVMFWLLNPLFSSVSFIRIMRDWCGFFPFEGLMIKIYLVKLIKQCFPDSVLKVGFDSKQLKVVSLLLEFLSLGRIIRNFSAMWEFLFHEKNFLIGTKLGKEHLWGERTLFRCESTFFHGYHWVFLRLTLCVPPTPLTEVLLHLVQSIWEIKRDIFGQMLWYCDIYYVRNAPSPVSAFRCAYWSTIGSRLAL